MVRQEHPIRQHAARVDWYGSRAGRDATIGCSSKRDCGGVAGETPEPCWLANLAAVSADTFNSMAFYHHWHVGEIVGKTVPNLGGGLICPSLIATDVY